ncbi:MAG: homocysteine S-methyltransferase family protein [Pseudomonadota bacterium]
MTSIDALRRSKAALLLDGSMGQELLTRGVRDDPVLWSAHVMDDNVAAVTDLHREYLHAGADIITTNTYSTNWNRFKDNGGRHRFETLNHRAGEAAQNAIQGIDRPAFVAASLPPMRDSYVPQNVLPFQQMLEEYGPQAEILSDYADVFLCETMSSGEEGLAAATAASEFAKGKPIWVSWTTQDEGTGLLRSGETIQAAAALLESVDVSGHLVNCSIPEAITEAVPKLMSTNADFHGAYGNGFESIPDTRRKGFGEDQLAERADLGPTAYREYAQRWLDQGVDLIGGCCLIGPAHIAALWELIEGR